MGRSFHSRQSASRETQPPSEGPRHEVRGRTRGRRGECGAQSQPLRSSEFREAGGSASPIAACTHWARSLGRCAQSSSFSCAWRRLCSSQSLFRQPRSCSCSSRHWREAATAIVHTRLCCCPGLCSAAIWRSSQRAQGGGHDYGVRSMWLWYKAAKKADAVKQSRGAEFSTVHHVFLEPSLTVRPSGAAADCASSGCSWQR